MKTLIIYLIFISGMLLFNQKSHCGELYKKDSIIYIQDSTSTNKFKYDSKIDPLIINFIKSILENPDKLKNFEENFPELFSPNLTFSISDLTLYNNYLIELLELMKNSKSPLSIKFNRKFISTENYDEVIQKVCYFYIFENPIYISEIIIEGFENIILSINYCKLGNNNYFFDPIYIQIMVH